MKAISFLDIYGKAYYEHDIGTFGQLCDRLRVLPEDLSQLCDKDEIEMLKECLLNNAGIQNHNYALTGEGCERYGRESDEVEETD